MTLSHTSFWGSFLTSKCGGNNPYPMLGIGLQNGTKQSLKHRGRQLREHQKIEAVVTGVWLKTETGLRL